MQKIKMSVIGSGLRSSTPAADRCVSHYHSFKTGTHQKAVHVFAASMCSATDSLENTVAHSSSGSARRRCI